LRHRSLPTVAAFIGILALTGCGLTMRSTIRLYPEPERPRDKVALLVVVSPLELSAVDDVRVPRQWGWDVRNLRVELLPGKHTLSAVCSYAISHYYQADGYMSEYKEYRGVPVTLTLVAEAGHTYHAVARRTSPPGSPDPPEFASWVTDVTRQTTELPKARR